MLQTLPALLAWLGAGFLLLLLHKACSSPLVGLLQKLIPAGKGVWASRDTAPASPTHGWVHGYWVQSGHHSDNLFVFFSWNSLSSAVYVGVHAHHAFMINSLIPV